MGAGATAVCLLSLNILLGRRIERAQIRQLASEVASNLVLGEVALDRFEPASLADISGMRLAVGPLPPSGGGSPGRGPRPRLDRRFHRQAALLRQDLCQRLAACPPVAPGTAGGRRGLWVQMASPLEVVWLFAPLPTGRGWPPDPLLFTLSIGVGGVSAMLSFLTLEVQRPLRQLEQAIADVELEALPTPLPERGATAVRRLTAHVNAMLGRLERGSRERRTMLAGIAHDLNAPLTRLRLRLGLAAGDAMGSGELRRAEADLAAMERITRQFLLFAGTEDAEPPVTVPLDALLAEVAAMADAADLRLELTPLRRRVRPTALTRAVGNLIDNALSHGEAPLCLVLRPIGAGGFEIQVWDQGPGIPAGQWERALWPFHRLDQARGGEGHCGLGLAIADRIARSHGGGLVRLTAGSSAGDTHHTPGEGGPGAQGRTAEKERTSTGPEGQAPGRFGVALRGWSLPAEKEEEHQGKDGIHGRP